MNELSDVFFDRYGFRHECRCAQDYIEDNTMHVPKCWVEMMDMSFDRLAHYRSFIKELSFDMSAEVVTDARSAELEVKINDFLDG
jgi:hypothetical protein